MNKATYRKNYTHLVRETTKILKVYGEAALKSGAVDLPSEKALFTLPKNVMCAALRHCQAEWGPSSGSLVAKSNQEEIDNIYRCTNLP
jgi:hypothetical protein